MATIILYYSQTGNTEHIATRIHENLGCDLLKIEPDSNEGGFMKLPSGFRTEIPDLSQYDIVFVGYPVWAHDVPPFVQKFIANCNLTGKIVIPFSTYAMGGFENTVQTMQKICTGAEVKNPFGSGKMSKGNYEDWIKAVRNLVDN
ncbi:MAG: flavodoxin [Eubacteriales bacterium]|nr:flavodoxin [Eubacteriales bacterium]